MEGTLHLNDALKRKQCKNVSSLTIVNDDDAGEDQVNLVVRKILVCFRKDPLWFICSCKKRVTYILPLLQNNPMLS